MDYEKAEPFSGNMEKALETALNRALYMYQAL
jgi:hypothetical protein